MSIEQARKALKNMMTKQTEELKTFVGKVVKVYEAKGLMDVEPVDGSPIYHMVKIVPSADNIIDGVVPIPAIGSFVICGKLNEQNAFLIVPGEIDKFIVKTKKNGTVELNGSQYSMVKGEVLEKELNKTKQVLDSLVEALTTWVVVPSDGGLALKTKVAEVLLGKASGDFKNINNKKVKHG